MPRDTDSTRRVSTALTAEVSGAGLKKLARLLEIRPIPSRKADIAHAILPHLKGRKLRALYEGLDELQQAAVAEAVHDPGHVLHAKRFAAKYGRQPRWGSLREYSSAPPTALCLFIFRQTWIPDDLAQRLRAFVPTPRALDLGGLESIPDSWAIPSTASGRLRARGGKAKQKTLPIEIREMEQAAQWDLHAVLRFIEAGRLAVSDRTGLPTAESQRALQSILHQGDFYPEPPPKAGRKGSKGRTRRRYDLPPAEAGPIRAFAWPLILQTAGLAKAHGKRLRLTPAGSAALEGPVETTLRRIWRQWIEGAWDELQRIDPIKGQRRKGRYGLTPPTIRRSVIAQALAECPPGRWVGTDEFFRHMQAAGHDFPMAQHPGALWELYIGHRKYGSMGYDGHSDWSFLQGRYTLCVLFEIAATLGLIDVAYVPPHGARPDYEKNWGDEGLPFLSRYDGLLYVRLTALGRYCLGRTRSYRSSSLEPALKILPNLEIASVGEALGAGDRFVLDRHAEPASDRTWRLDRRRLLAAAQDGPSVDEFRAFLESRSCEPLPATVVRFFEEATGRSRALIDRGDARLFECSDPETAALIAGDSAMRNLCIRAGEHHLVVQAIHARRFETALHKLGYGIAEKRATRTKGKQESLFAREADA